MERRPHLFCYIIPEDLNTEIEDFCDSNDIAQSLFVRACFEMATKNKTSASKLMKAVLKDGRKVNGTQKKKLIYLSIEEYSRLQHIRNDSQTSMASILRTGIELHKERVAKKLGSNL